MAQLQFRSDDTIVWAEKFGNGSNGDLTISTATNYNPVRTTGTGTGATNEIIVVDNSSFNVGDIIAIHQTRHATLHGIWQLNVVVSKPSGKLELKYPLVVSFNAAQVIQIPQHLNVEINDTYSLPAYNDTTGGIGFILAKKQITGSGTLNGVGVGFLGGPQDNGGGGGSAQSGKSYGGTSNTTNRTAYFGAGGGGLRQPNLGHGGGGGGHKNAGGNGEQSGSGGLGGAAHGQDDLVLIYPGSGGGAGGGDSDASPAFSGAPGGRGAGIWVLISPNINLSNLAINVNGQNGTSRPTGNNNGGGGGGSAAGSALLKGVDIVLGNNKVTAVGGLGQLGGLELKAGDGSVGRIHADYSGSISGTTNPTIDSRIDPTIKIGGKGSAFLLAFQ